VDDYLILFLDGDPNRAAVLHQRMSPDDVHNTIWVRTVEEALDILINYREALRYVSLDHDLGGETFVHSGREDCGMEIVRWLEKQPYDLYSHIVFIIHSWNTSAGHKMAARLKVKGYRVLYVPFGMSVR
jgi:hypothetical protein